MCAIFFSFRGHTHLPNPPPLGMTNYAGWQLCYTIQYRLRMMWVMMMFRLRMTVMLRRRMMFRVMWVMMTDVEADMGDGVQNDVGDDVEL